MWRWWNYFASHNHFTFLRVSRTVELGFDVHDLNWLVSRLLNAHDLWIKIISVYLIFTGGLLVLWASYLSMVLKCLQETCKILDFSCELTENIYCKQKIFIPNLPAAPITTCGCWWATSSPRTSRPPWWRRPAGRTSFGPAVGWAQASPVSREASWLKSLHCETVKMRQDS